MSAQVEPGTGQIMHTPSLTTKQTLRLHTNGEYYRTLRTVTVSSYAILST